MTTVTHNLIDLISYPNHHFALFTPNRLQLHSNTEVHIGDTIKQGGNLYTITKVKSVKPSNPDMIKEASDTIIVNGDILNPRFIIGVTKYYTLEVEPSNGGIGV